MRVGEGEGTQVPLESEVWIGSAYTRNIRSVGTG